MPQAVETPASSDVSGTYYFSSSTAFFYDHFLAPSWLKRQAKQMLPAEKTLCKHDIFQTVDENGDTFHLLNTMYSSVKTKDTSFICIDL